MVYQVEIGGGVFGSPGDDEELALSGRWLADIQQSEGFNQDDEKFLNRLQQLGGRVISMLASQQRTRERYIEGGAPDPIADQLRVLKEVFKR